MTLKECYAAMGGNYDEVFSRLRADERIAKFLARVVTDQSFAELESSLQSGDAVTAFRAAHTIKGICLNLSLTALFNSVHVLTDVLRDKTEIPAEAHTMFEAVKADYTKTITAINAYIAG